jgi:putative redox protein
MRSRGEEAAMYRREPAVGQATSRAIVQTSCGRQLVVGRLRLDGLAPPVGRVTLDIGCQPYDHGEVWASLTAAEARQLAGLLLARAADIEDDSG